MLSACADPELRRLGLTSNPSTYLYTSKGDTSVPAGSDRSNYRSTVAACKTLGFSQAEVDVLWNVVAAILHMVSLTGTALCLHENHLQRTEGPLVELDTLFEN